jgi:hypothetical protein
MPAGSRTPDREALRTLTLRVRALLETIVTTADEAGQVLDEVECSAGLVDEDGKRFDE